jgi:hypothetical protein
MVREIIGEKQRIALGSWVLIYFASKCQDVKGLADLSLISG